MPTGTDSNLRGQTWRNRVIYWDTCVLLAWLKNEPRKAGEMEGVIAAAREVMQGKTGLITSTLTRAEVFDGKLERSERDKFRKLFRRSNVQFAPFDLPVARLTSDIREHYADSEFELLTPDAMHLATAINYKVLEFQTFDSGNQRLRNPSKYKYSGLLPLGNMVAGHNLRIRKPTAQQLSLDLSDPIDDDEDDEQKTDPPPVGLRRGSDGPPEGQAAAEGQAEAEGESGEEAPEESE